MQLVRSTTIILRIDSAVCKIRSTLASVSVPCAIRHPTTHSTRPTDSLSFSSFSNSSSALSSSSAFGSAFPLPATATVEAGSSIRVSVFRSTVRPFRGERGSKQDDRRSVCNGDRLLLGPRALSCRNWTMNISTWCITDMLKKSKASCVIQRNKLHRGVTQPIFRDIFTNFR